MGNGQDMIHYASEFTLGGLNVFFLPPFLVGIFLIAVGIQVLAREGGSQSGMAFSWLMMTAAIWLMSYGVAFSTHRDDRALVWLKVGHVGISLLPSVMLLTGLAITKKLRVCQSFLWASLSLSNLFLVVGLLTDYFVAGVQRYFWGFYPKFGPLSFPYMIFFFAVMVFILRLFWDARLHGPTEIHRLRMKAFFIATGIGFLCAIDFLPAYGIAVYPFGYVFMLLFSLLVMRIVWKHPLVELTPAFAAHQILKTMRGAVLVVDLEGRICIVNPDAIRMLGYSESELLDRPINELIEIPSLEGISFVFQEERIWRAKNGRPIHVSVLTSVLNDSSGSPAGVVHIGLDITERKEMEERLRHLGLHDTLTGLPNRNLFADRLQQAIARAIWRKRIVAVLYLDLDRFKVINDTLGHAIGDLLLKGVGERLKVCVRDGDTVARMGGDEFVIILNDVARSEDVEMVARKIQGAFRNAFIIQGHELDTTPSIGISMLPADGSDPETLIHKADAAMYRAKQKGRNNFHFCTD
jgi:diguanylate cyclase (GGDEF)-like protein/PAS domain S-box-containing protein